MLQIDLKKSQHVTKKPNNLNRDKEPNPNGMNAYNSLNRATRIKNLAKIVDDNKSMLNRLQGAQSHYDNNRWRKDFTENHKKAGRISQNGDRFCRNPYFLHSVCTQEVATVSKIQS